MDQLIDPCPTSPSGIPAHFFLTLMNTLLASKCSISSPERYPLDKSSQLKDNDEFDFIVIGAGSAGSIVANVLSENPDWRVLVLEAGEYPTAAAEVPSLIFSLQGTESDWQYTTEPSSGACLGFKDGRCRWPRGKCLGGSSSINGMLYLRGNKRDYDNWYKQGNEGWDYDSVLKYFRELEDLKAEQLANSSRYGRGGPIPLNLYNNDNPVVDALKKSAQALGYSTTNEESNLGYFEALLNKINGLRANTGKIFLGNVKNRSNLIVSLRSHVEKIIIDENNKANAVAVTLENRKIIIKARKEIIVSAGAINSPKLLMLSGIGPAKHLQDVGIEVKQDLKVGENLQDHVGFWGFYVKVAEEAVKPKEDPIDHIYQFFKHQRGPISEFGITNFMGFINSKNDSQYPNLQILHVYYEKNDNYLLPEILRRIGVRDDLASVQLQENQIGPGFLIAPIVANPKSKGRILLKSKDANEKPLIYANYFEDPADLETMLQGIRYAEKQIESVAFEKLKPQIVNLYASVCKDSPFKSDDFWKCAIRHLSSTVYHLAGTCKMGPSSDSNAVVDSRLRVHGIQKLRVIDASIMPNVVSVNTNGAAMVIGKKGGHMIAEDWKFDVQHEEL